MSTYLLQTSSDATHTPSASRASSTSPTPSTARAPSKSGAPSTAQAQPGPHGHADPLHLEALFRLIVSLHGTVEGAWAGRRGDGDAVVLASLPGDCGPDVLAQELSGLQGYSAIQMTALSDAGPSGRDDDPTATVFHHRGLSGALAAVLGTGHALIV